MVIPCAENGAGFGDMGANCVKPSSKTGCKIWRLGLLGLVWHHGHDVGPWGVRVGSVAMDATKRLVSPCGQTPHTPHIRVQRSRFGSDATLPVIKITVHLLAA